MLQRYRRAIITHLAKDCGTTRSLTAQSFCTCRRSYGDLLENLKTKPAAGLNALPTDCTHQAACIDTSKNHAPVDVNNLVYLSGPSGIVQDVPHLSSLENLPESVPRALLSNFASKKISEPTLLQKTIIPLLLKEDSLIVRASTGMGKTFSICIAAIAHCNAKKPPQGYSSIKKLQEPQENKTFIAAPRIVVVAPTNDRVQSIVDKMKSVLHGLPWRVYGLFSGGDIQRQYQTMGKIGCDIIVSTCDRLREYIQGMWLESESIECLFLDEADSLLSNRKSDIDYVFQSVQNIRKFIFATYYPLQLQEITERYLSANTLRLEVGFVPDVEHHVKFTPGEMDKVRKLEELMERGDINKNTRVVIFTSKKQGVRSLFERLSVITVKYGIFARSITNDVSLNVREESAKSIRSGGGRILVLTDTYSWMLGTSVDIIINYEMPSEMVTFHQRCAYAGAFQKKGKIYTFIDEITHPAVVKPLVQHLREGNHPVSDELVRKSESTCITAPETGTQNTYEWIRQSALHEEKKEVKTFIPPAHRARKFRPSVATTATPRSKTKGLPTISF